MAILEFQKWFGQLSSTGDICPIKLGMSRGEVQAILGEPDDKGSGPSRRRRGPSVWLYGDLEFHFDGSGGDALFLIYRDTDDGHVEISIKNLQADD